MAARKPTLFQQAQKEIRRLEKAARRIEKRGYEFNLPFRFTKEGGLKTRYTRKEVESLKSLKAKDLYKYATAYGMSGERYREIERSRAAQKAVETKRGLNKPFEFDARKAKKEFEGFKSISSSIIDNFIDPAIWLFKGSLYIPFKEALEEAIDITSKDYVAEIIQEMTNSGLAWQVHRGYKPEHFDNLFPKFLNFIKDRLPSMAEKIIDFETEDDEDDEISIDELASRITTRNMTEEEREFYEQRWGR